MSLLCAQSLPAGAESVKGMWMQGGVTDGKLSADDIELLPDVLGSSMRSVVYRGILRRDGKPIEVIPALNPTIG